MCSPAMCDTTQKRFAASALSVLCASPFADITAVESRLLLREMEERRIRQMSAHSRAV